MNVTYTVQFKGFHEKAAAALEKMLVDDIAAYPKRLRMESAVIVEVEDAKKAAAEPRQRKLLEPKERGKVLRTVIKRAVKEVKRNAKSR